MKRVILAILASMPLVMLSVNASATGDDSDKKVKKEYKIDDKAAKKEAAIQAKKAKEDAKIAAKEAKKQAKKAKEAAKKAKKAAKNQAKKDKAEPTVHSVPEIDAAGAALALGLLGGVAAIRRERKKALLKKTA